MFRAYLSFSPELSRYMILAREPFEKQLNPETVTEKLEVTSEQAQELIAAVRLIRREWSREENATIKERASLGLGYPSLMHALGMMSGNAHSLLGTVSFFAKIDEVKDLTQTSHEDLERLNWKLQGIGDITRTEIAKIYEALGVVNQSLQSRIITPRRKRQSFNISDARAEITTVLKAGGVDEDVIKRLFGEAAPAATDAHRQSARRILRGQVPAATVQKVLGRS